MEQERKAGGCPKGKFNFRTLVGYSIKVNQRGWYATRQQMLREGGDLRDVARVLAWRLEILGGGMVREAQHGIVARWASRL